MLQFYYVAIAFYTGTYKQKRVSLTSPPMCPYHPVHTGATSLILN